VVGDGNVVNTSYTDLSRALTDLRTAVLAAPELSDVQKLDGASDIDALLAQLQKPQPSRGVVRELWAGVQGVATAGGFAQAIEQIAALLAPLIG
jgi:hypothetical protein